MSSGENLHDGHRERLKRRIINGENVEEHELLEALLFFALPRKNTNMIAHKLINRFGNLAGVFEADMEELMEIEGVGRHAAELIKLQLPLCRQYLQPKNGMRGDKVTPVNVGSKIRNLFLGYTNEVLFAVMLDSSFSIISCEKISEGTTNSSPVYSREIIKRALAAKASNVILAHNHPNGLAVPSSADIEVTKLVDNALTYVNVRLIDHLIVTHDECVSILRVIGRMNYKQEKEKGEK